jgi:hypothetical protein
MFKNTLEELKNTNESFKQKIISKYINNGQNCEFN